jgi:hypothetical protein
MVSTNQQFAYHKTLKVKGQLHQDISYYFSLASEAKKMLILKWNLFILHQVIVWRFSCLILSSSTYPIGN